jgi:glucose-1-phosphatase
LKPSPNWPRAISNRPRRISSFRAEAIASPPLPPPLPFCTLVTGQNALIRAIVFDLGKVIIPFELERGYKALGPHCGLEPAEIPKRLRSSDLVVRFESGQIAPEQFVRELSLLLELDVDYERFCELWSSIFLPESLIPEALLAALHKRYPLLLLSNTNAIHFEMVRERYPLLAHFDQYILSYEVGAMKPDRRIYEEAVRRAGVPAGEMFFTDDIPQYVAAAREVGLDAVEFRSAGQVEEELRARGVEW